jgi:hypothetical protein
MKDQETMMLASDGGNVIGRRHDYATSLSFEEDTLY